MPLELTAWWERSSDPGPGPADPRRSGELFHQPAMWYSARWPEMPCFALPSIAHGYIRINVQGREAHGLVPADRYSAFCQDLALQLRAVRNARTGRPLVTRIVRTREIAADRPDVPDADLVVMYDDEPTDVVDSPTLGRIGPVPYARTGGHINRGVAILKGAGCLPGSTLPAAHVRDVAPTVLAWLGASQPAFMDGTSMFPAAMERVPAQARG
jgi:predicted AlkP superfamily phosphohydrolase/phosphomutase